MNKNQNENGLQHDIFVRAYTKKREAKSKNFKAKNSSQNDPKWPDHVLVLDCESRLSPDQSLTFGFWQFCEVRERAYICLEEGILHDTNLKRRELNALRRYARSQKPNTADDGCDRLRMYSLPKFITDVLGIAIQAGALIVGFNAGFDLSRLALDWEDAQKGGWSLILSQWRNPKDNSVQANKFFPRIVIKALNSKTSIIHSTRAPMAEAREEGEKVKHWPSAR